MSVEYCHKHNIYYDTDRVVMCPYCDDDFDEIRFWNEEMMTKEDEE